MGNTIGKDISHAFNKVKKAKGTFRIAVDIASARLLSVASLINIRSPIKSAMIASSIIIG